MLGGNPIDLPHNCPQHVVVQPNFVERILLLHESTINILALPITVRRRAGKCNSVSANTTKKRAKLHFTPLHLPSPPQHKTVSQPEQCDTVRINYAPASLSLGRLRSPAVGHARINFQQPRAGDLR